MRVRKLSYYTMMYLSTYDVNTSIKAILCQSLAILLAIMASTINLPTINIYGYLWLSLAIYGYLCLSIYAYLSMPIYLCLSIYAFLSMPIYLCLSIYAYLPMPIYLSIYRSVSAILCKNLLWLLHKILSLFQIRWLSNN